MRRMIAASVARRIALKKMGAGALALAAVADAGQLNPDSPQRIAGAGGDVISSYPLKTQKLPQVG
jgi:iron complex transport system substrate-binding protein